MFRDIFGTFNAWSHNSELVSLVYSQTGNLIPENSVEITLPKLIIGVGYLFRISDNFGILPALDLDLTFDGARNVVLSSDVVSIDPHFGFELDYRKIAFLRGGIAGVQEIKDFDGSTYWTFQPGFGLGVNIKSLVVDYAFLDIGDQSESLYSHVFSIQVSID